MNDRQKVKCQDCKVTQHCGTKTSNISRKRHPVVEVRNQCRRGKWRGQMVDRKLLNSSFCACVVKMCLKLH